MELQEVIDSVRNEYKSDLAKQIAEKIAEKLALLYAENIKYVKEGKHSFNHGMNVGQTKALSWVLEQLKEQEGE